jgi:hypothetical protein
MATRNVMIPDPVTRHIQTLPVEDRKKILKLIEELYAPHFDDPHPSSVNHEVAHIWGRWDYYVEYNIQGNVYLVKWADIKTNPPPLC